MAGTPEQEMVATLLMGAMTATVDGIEILAKHETYLTPDRRHLYLYFPTTGSTYHISVEALDDMSRADVRALAEQGEG